jgi:3-oxoacyl-[acyl-carrier protein] reductase
MVTAEARVALVTGASRGIGRAIAVALGQAGHRVAVNYQTRDHEAKETVAMIERTGGFAIGIQADISDPRDVAKCFTQVAHDMGPVSVLVNNAGLRRDGLGLSMTDEAWSQVIATCLSGTFYCSRAALRPMLRQRFGRIVNIASVAGLRGSAGQANYSAAKSGVLGLTKTLAREVAAKGITVNAVAPGLIDTDLTAELDDRQRHALVSEIPAKRAGTAEEVASLVGWLCSDGAAYVTGSVISVDGGMSA